MIKRLFVLVGVLISMLLLGGCGSTLPATFDEDEVQALAHEIVEFTFADNYEAIYSLANEDFVSRITVPQLQSSVNAYLVQAGDFEEIKETVIGGVDADESENGQEYASAVVLVKCTKKDLTFTINLTNDQKVCGYFIK